MNRSVAELLPHAGEAVLIEEIRELCADGLVACMTVRPGSTLSLPDGSLADWAVPEVMAQAIAVFSRLTARETAGQGVGLLLGVREFSVSRARFAAGTRLQVDVTETTRDDDSRGVFSCRVSVEGEPVAEGRLTVFEPADPWAALAEQIS